MSSFPICQVCHQPFSLRGPAPFLLPCFHAVCETCVISAAGGVISCTTCQRDVNLTETQLQKDVVRQKEIFHLTVQHHPAQILCTHEDDGNQAVCWCEDCEDFMCEHCQMMHDSYKGTRRHTVQKIDDIKPEISDKDEYCSVHSKNLLHLWDKTCKTLICHKCRRDNHAEHDLEDIEEAAQSAKKKMIELGKDVRSTIDQHKAQVHKAKTELNTFTETCDMLAEKVSNTFHSFKTALEQREKELLIGLQQHKEQVAADLTLKRKNSESKHQKCMMTSDYISKSLQYSSPNLVLSLMEAVETATEKCLTTAPAEGPEDVTMPTFHAVELDKLMKILSECELFTKERSTDLKEGSAAHNQSVQTEESMNVIEDLKKKLCQNEKMMKDLIGQKMKIENLNHTLLGWLNGVTVLNSTYHVLREEAKIDLVLNCIHLEFSQNKCNGNYVHINSNQELENRENPKLPSDDRSLKKYIGTSSNIPVPRCGSPLYWETRTRVGIHKTLTDNNLLLEIGLVRKEEQDQHHYIYIRPHSYCLIVAHCNSHSSICRKVWRHGEKITCLSDTMSNTPDTSTTLHLGVVYDSTRCKVAFLDLTDMNIIGVLDNVDSTEPLWPMFGLYNPTIATVCMSLVVGSDIDMSEDKRALIIEALCQ